MFPQLLTVVAIFLLLTWLGDVYPVLGIGSRLALIMVYLGGALGANTYLMYGFFNTVPQSLDEAARVDGAGHARIFFTLILPLAAPHSGGRGSTELYWLLYRVCRGLSDPRR